MFGEDFHEVIQMIFFRKLFDTEGSHGSLPRGFMDISSQVGDNLGRATTIYV